MGRKKNIDTNSNLQLSFDGFENVKEWQYDARALLNNAEANRKFWLAKQAEKILGMSDFAAFYANELSGFYHLSDAVIDELNSAAEAMCRAAVLISQANVSLQKEIIEKSQPEALAELQATIDREKAIFDRKKALTDDYYAGKASDSDIQAIHAAAGLEPDSIELDLAASKYFGKIAEKEYDEKNVNL